MKAKNNAENAALTPKTWMLGEAPYSSFRLLFGSIKGNQSRKISKKEKRFVILQNKRKSHVFKKSEAVSHQRLHGESLFTGNSCFGEENQANRVDLTIQSGLDGITLTYSIKTKQFPFGNFEKGRLTRSKETSMDLKAVENTMSSYEAPKIVLKTVVQRISLEPQA